MAFENKPRPVSAEVVPAQGQALVVYTTDLETSIQGFSAPLAGYLDSLGLPIDNVLVEFSER